MKQQERFSSALSAYVEIITYRIAYQGGAENVGNGTILLYILIILFRTITQILIFLISNRIPILRPQPRLVTINF